jgi:hypothetical protein
MSDELPRCRLCSVPYGADHPRTCPLWDVLMSEAEWRRLHGPRPADMTTTRLASALVRYGVIDESAIEDPNGYDGGTTLEALALAARDLSAAGPHLESDRPEHAELYAACMAYRHDFGLLDFDAQTRLRDEALRWYEAWSKAAPRLAPEHVDDLRRCVAFFERAVTFDGKTQAAAIRAALAALGEG